jgi:hypothetical protein
MTISNLEELRRLGEVYLESARDQIAAGDDVAPLVILLDPIVGMPELVGISPELMACEHNKELMFEALKTKIDEGGFTAVMTMFDSHQLKARDPLELRQIDGLKKLGFSFREISEKIGIGEYVEAVVLSVETIDGRGFKLTQEYRGKPPAFEPVEYREGLASEGRSRFFGKEQNVDR